MTIQSTGHALIKGIKIQICVSTAKYKQRTLRVGHIFSDFWGHFKFFFAVEP